MTQAKQPAHPAPPKKPPPASSGEGADSALDAMKRAAESKPAPLEPTAHCTQGTPVCLWPGEKPAR